MTIATIKKSRTELGTRDREKLLIIIAVLKATYGESECLPWPRNQKALLELVRQLSPRFDHYELHRWKTTVGHVGKKRNYGTFITLAGSVINAHTAVAILNNKQAAEDEEIDHICEDETCVQEKHLWAVSPQSNSDRRTRASVNQETIDGISRRYTQPQIDMIGKDKRNTKLIAASFRTIQGLPATQRDVIAIKMSRGLPFRMASGDLIYSPITSRKRGIARKS